MQEHIGSNERESKVSERERERERWVEAKNLTTNHSNAVSN